MEDFYEELWGKSSHLKITEYVVKVPQPEFYIDPEHRARVGAESSSLQLTGISKKRISKRFAKVQPRRFFPPMNMSFILRDEYDRIEELLEEIESRKWKKQRRQSIAHRGVSLDYKVSGQPGSGKSTFLVYLLARRLVARQPTVYRVDDQKCYYFDEVHRGCRKDANYLFDLPDKEKRDLWILTDQALTDPLWNKTWHSWFVVLGCSEKKVDLSEQWVKERNLHETYMNNWEWDEIYAAFTLDTKSPSDEEIQNLYSTFICLGPVARTCLTTVSAKLGTEEYDARFKAYVTKIDNQIQSVSAKFQFGSLSNAVGCFETHKIIRMEPCLKNTAYTTEIITRWIACRILSSADCGAKERGYKIFQSLCQHPTIRTSAGWFFEAYAHQWLRQGGRFEADMLSLKDSYETLSFGINFASPGEPQYYKTSTDLAGQLKNSGGKGVEHRLIGTYFQPRCPTQESFDSLVVIDKDTLILFQITMAMTHEIKVDGVRAMVQALPQTLKKVFIVFVIPEDRVENYQRPQKAPTNNDLRIRRREYTIKQFRLVFPNDELLSIAVPKPSVS